METLKMQACVQAVLAAAKVNNWQHVLDLGTDDIEEMLEESDVETVDKYVLESDYDAIVEAAERAAGWSSSM